MRNISILVATTKQAQRKQLISRLLGLGTKSQADAGKAIADKLETWIKADLSGIGRPFRFALFAGVRHELRTDAIDRALHATGQLRCYPRVEGRDLRFFELPYDCKPQNLPRGSYGIPEPPLDYKEVSVASLDIVLTPAIGLTLQGQRLGQGGGFYDRLMSKSNTLNLPLPFIAMIMDEQIEPQLVVEPHDHQVHGIISPSLNQWTSRGASFYRHPLHNLLADHQ